MTRRPDHDEAGIIGDRPKAKPADLGPLFDFATPAEVREIIAGNPESDDTFGDSIRMFDNGESIIAGADPGPAFDFDSPCEQCGYGFNQHALGVHGCPNCHGEGIERDDDAQPPAPHKPEPPTKEEREAAIARVQEKTEPVLIELARRRVTARGPFAVEGVTADDAWLIATDFAEAALIGTGARAWSWLGPWLASLARRGVLVPYTIRGHKVRRQARARDASHGNAHVVYLHPTDLLAETLDA